MGLGRLQGKVAVVTGAASGIGEATAKLFAEEGAKVLACDVPGSPLVEAHAGDENILCVECDVTAADAVDKLIDGAVRAFGGLDILFNNAGVVPNEAVEELTEESWTRCMEVNVNALMRLSKAAVAPMRARGRGRIINIGSIQSEVAGTGLTAYTTSKHAVAGISKSLANELGPYGITCNFIQPGAIETGITKDLLATSAEFKQYWIDKTPAGRWGLPIDIANTALFLAGDESDFVSGIGIRVDGGAMCHN